MSHAVALLGWSLPAIEAAQKLGKPFVVVSFADFQDYADKHGIPFVAWDFAEWNEEMNSLTLHERLEPFGAKVAVPLYEETVEWAGALNALYRDDPKVHNRSFLFRNKAIMKRKALLSGLRVGLFEEVTDKAGVRAFMDRVNQANANTPGDLDAWVHLKPFAAMGTVGHRLLRTKQDIDDKLTEADFPSLVESHLAGREFSCEAFIHDGKIRFLNVTEYVKLGHSNFIPASPELASKRPIIERAMQRLVKGFGIEYGLIHPEWFLTEDDEVSFGEVANRIPGGHMFELMNKVYGFDPYQAHILCSDPATSEDELAAAFPAPDYVPDTVAGCLMVYPKPGYVSRLQVPAELEEDPYFEDHTLFEPSAHKVGSEREGYGNHYGTVFLKGEDTGRMKDLLTHYEGVDFYA
ncbi:MAG: hypothetical protein U5K81_13165 [Trueperaceae bacterium]|nr:hypothetical protein [Trueperaceae bacterium]